MVCRKPEAPFVTIASSFAREIETSFSRTGGVDTSVEEMPEEGASALFLLLLGSFLRFGAGLAGSSPEDFAALGFSVAFAHEAGILT